MYMPTSYVLALNRTVYVEQGANVDFLLELGKFITKNKSMLKRLVVIKQLTFTFI